MAANICSIKALRNLVVDLALSAVS